MSFYRGFFFDTGGQVGTILLWPLGGIVICGPTQGGVKEDLLVALAGPLAHIPQALFWLIIFVIAARGDFTFFVTQTAASQPVYPSVLSNGFGGFMTVLSARAFWLNLYIMALNLFLPAFPLDGGRCLANILVLCGKSVERAARVTAITSLAVGSVMILFGVITYFCFLNCSFLLVVWIGATIVLSGKKLLDMVRDGRLAQHPLFGRECYTERQQQQQESQPEMTPQEQAAAEVI